MSVAADLFGVAYLDAESFREHADLFGVGMSLADYKKTADNDAKLSRVLQAASRAVDAFCGKNFLAAAKTEKHALPESWQIRVNNPPVAAVSSCVIRVGSNTTMTIQTGDLYINNQKAYVEIPRDLTTAILTQNSLKSLAEATVEITYTSLQSVPGDVKLAAGYQAAHMINTGFVDKVLPPNFGKVDMGGLDINNKRGARSSEEAMAASFSPEAARLLIPHKQFVAA